MTEEEMHTIKTFFIEGYAKVKDLSRHFENINKLSKTDENLANKISSCLAILEAFIEMQAFEHGNITGNELRGNEDNIPPK